MTATTAELIFYSDCSPGIAPVEVVRAAELALADTAALAGLDPVPELVWCVPASACELDYMAEWGEPPGLLLHAPTRFVAGLGTGHSRVWCNALEEDELTMFLAVAMAATVLCEIRQVEADDGGE